MSKLLQARRVRVVIAIAMMICLLVLLVPHAGSHGSLLACVLLFPMFLFGSLDLSWLFQAPAYESPILLPQFPVLNALFQRPPPSVG